MSDDRDPARFALACSVTNAAGDPLPDVNVYVYECSSFGCMNPELASGEPLPTDAAGRFNADGLTHDGTSEKHLTAGFFHPRYARRFVHHLEGLPRDAEGTVHVAVTLDPGHSVSGFVRDEAGRPVAKAQLSIGAERFYAGDPGCARPPAQWGVETGPDGRYEAHGLPPHRYRIEVEPTDGREGSATVDLRALAHAQVDVSVTAAVAPKEPEPETTFTLRGRLVVRDTGAPVAGVYVFVTQLCAGFLYGPAATSDDDGRFEIVAVPPGEHYLATSGEHGFVGIYRPLTVARDQDLGDVPLHAGATLTGVVTDAEGRAVPGAEVFLDSGAYYDGLTGFADDDGVFRFWGLVDGSYQLRVRAAGHASSLAPSRVLPVEAGENRHDVCLSRGSTLRGRVTYGGRPIAGQSVVLVRAADVIDAGRKIWLDDAVTDDTGAFCFERVAVGRWELRTCLVARQVVVPSEGEAPECIVDAPYDGEGFDG